MFGRKPLQGASAETTTGRPATPPPRRCRVIIGVIVVCLGVLVGVGGLVGVASAADDGTAIDSCTTIDESGSYYLNDTPTSGASPCIDITTTDVELDGNGERINESSVGVRIDAGGNASNVTIENLTIEDAGDTAIDVDVASKRATRNLTVSNVTMENVADGFVFGSESASSTSQVDISLLDSNISATSDAIRVNGFNDEQYDVDIERNDIDTTSGDNGVYFSLTDDGTDVDLSMLDNTIESDGSDGVSLNLERSHATTNLELRRNNITTTGSLSDAVDIKSGGSSDVNTTVNVTADSNTLTTPDDTLRLELWGSEGSRDIDFVNNSLDAGDIGYEIIAKGDNTSVDFRVVDNVISSGGDQILDIQGDQYDYYPNQTLDLVMKRNEMTEEVSVAADGRDAPVNATVVNNTFTDERISIDFDLVRYNSSRSIDIRRNTLNGSLFVDTGGRNNDTNVTVSKNSIRQGPGIEQGDADASDGIVIDTAGAQCCTFTNYAPYQTVNVEVTDNVVNGSQGIVVDSYAPSSTANLSIVNNSIPSSGDYGDLRVDVDADNSTVDADIKRNEIADGSDRGIRVTASGDDETVALTARNNTVDSEVRPIWVSPEGNDQDLDFSFADNDLNVTTDGSNRYGIWVDDTGRNSTQTVSATDNIVNSTRQGIEVELTPREGDDARDPIDITAENNTIDAGLDGIKLFKGDSTYRSTDRNLTISVRENSIEAGDYGTYVDTRNDFGTNDVTVVNNSVSAGSDALSLHHEGEETEKTVAIENNNLTTSNSPRGVYLNVKVDSSFGSPGDADLTITDNDVTAKDTGFSTGGIFTEMAEENMSVDANISRNTLTTVDDAIRVAAAQDNMSTTFTVEANDVSPGKNTGIVLEGGDNHTATWDVLNNTVEEAETGIEVDGVQMQDAGSYDVTLRGNDVDNASEIGLLITPESGSASRTGTVSIEENTISSDESAVQIEDGPVAGIDLSTNTLDGDDWGVENLNTTAGYVNATDNYWGTSDGPDSLGPLSDPVTGALANGSGSNITERGSGVSNVYFDSFRTSPPDLSGTTDFTVSIDKTNAPVTEGETLTVDATVDNTGTANGTQTVTLSADGSDRDSVNLELNSSESESVALNWTTSEGDDGSYTATVETADDSDTESVNVTTASDGDDDDDTTSGGGGGGSASTSDDEDEIEAPPDIEETSTIEESSVDFENADTVDGVNFDEEATGSVEVEEYDEPPTAVDEAVSEVVADELATEDGASDDESTAEDGTAAGAGGGTDPDVVTVADVSPTDPDAEESSATVEFEVDREEFDDPADAVVFHEADDGWTDVETTVEETDGETLTVAGQVESFSLFAVAEVESDAGTQTDASTSESTTDDGDTSESTDDTGDDDSGGIGAVVIGVLVVAGGIGAVYVLRQ